MISPRDLRPREYVDCPLRFLLERPLGERVVVDVDTGKRLLCGSRGTSAPMEDGLRRWENPMR